MKTLLIIFITIQFVSVFAISVVHGEDDKPTTCAVKRNTATEYTKWKKDFQKFLADYDSLSSSKKFDHSKQSMKVILTQMQTFSDQTSVPLSEGAYNNAKDLIAEIEAGRIPRTTALPILKSSLQKMEDMMDDMIAKAQWKNPNCEIAFTEGNEGAIKSALRN